MAHHKDGSHTLHPPTEVLTRGFDPALSVGSARPAVFRSSTYVFESPEAAEKAFDVVSGRTPATEGQRPDLIYARFAHPNAEILEDQVVPLEPGARSALVFNSGMSAIMTVLMTFMRPGSSIVYTSPVYGGTAHLIEDFLPVWGVSHRRVPAGDGAALDRAIENTDNVAIVFIETPGNPTLVMTDIARAVETAARRPNRPLVVVDNTFMGPAFQHPLALGADMTVYSATKYLSGFSDMIAGLVLARDPELTKKMYGVRGLFGNILQPDECWMLDSRLPTVSLRMNRQSKNAQRIAERLAGRPEIRRVLYPSLFEDTEQIRICRTQCDFPGGIFSIDLHGGREAAFEFIRRLRIARDAVSLGGVETLVCHPRTTTHSSMPREELDAAGIGEGLVRVSVGIEDWRDLLADFEHALDACGAAVRTGAGALKTRG